MKLRQAKTEDLREIITWIHDKKSCRLWAGPGLRYPFLWERFLTDLGFFTYDTYVLAGDNTGPVGMGQIIQRDDYFHLARIIINPDNRGLGYGRILCENLMQKGISDNKNKPFSLNVYRHNQVAIELYKSLGFTIYPDQSKVTDPDSVFMTCLD